MGKENARVLLFVSFASHALGQEAHGIFWGLYLIVLFLLLERVR